jgi:protein-S-isoprenylcysteine O-methyltransferase Ste14
MSANSAHKSWWQISEVVFGIPFLVAIALQLVEPFSLPRGFLRIVFIIGGIAFIILGLTFIIFARREFTRHGQPTDPGHPTTSIVTESVYSLSRNPIYLGAASFLIGIDLAVDLPWGLILLLPSLVACHYILIKPEERYLVARFGDEYRSYANKVHRWIGRSGSYR